MMIQSLTILGGGTSGLVSAIMIKKSFPHNEIINKDNEDIKPELIKAISPQFFNDKFRTSALISTCSILNS